MAKKQHYLSPDEYNYILQTRADKTTQTRERIRLDSDEEVKLEEYRESKEGARKECEANGLPFEDLGMFWYKSKKYSLNFKPNKSPNYLKIRDEVIKDMKQYAPTYEPIKYVKQKDGHCLVFDPADIHIGKICSSFETGETYNAQIAVARVKEGLQGILNKAQGFAIDKVIFIAGNDVLHIDNPHNTTTSGTRQDTDGMWYDSFTLGKNLLVEIIETLMQVAPVEVVFNPSNHDFMSGFMLIDSIASWFNKCDSVTFNNDMSHRKYTKYGQNLIGSTHGDGAKHANLPLLMAEDAPEMWATCKHRYIYTHHLHHKTAKDYGSVCVETLRSPSGTDSWHHRKGFVNSPKAVEAFIHHKDHGQIARFTHIF